MVTCLGQPHQFIKQFSDIRARRQASIQIVNQPLVESAVVHAVNCCLTLRGFSHQYGNCLRARCVVCGAGVASQRTQVARSALFLCLLQGPCLRSAYYYDYLAIKNKVSLHVETFSQCFVLPTMTNNNFVLVKAESIRRMPWDRPKWAESIRVCTSITAATTLPLSMFSGILDPCTSLVFLTLIFVSCSSGTMQIVKSDYPYAHSDYAIKIFLSLQSLHLFSFNNHKI